MAAGGRLSQVTHWRSKLRISPPPELGLARVRHFKVAQVGYIRLGLGEVGEQSEPGGGQDLAPRSPPPDRHRYAQAVDLPRKAGEVLPSLSHRCAYAIELRPGGD